MLRPHLAASLGHYDTPITSLSVFWCQVNTINIKHLNLREHWTIYLTFLAWEHFYLSSDIVSINRSCSTNNAIVSRANRTFPKTMFPYIIIKIIHWPIGVWRISWKQPLTRYSLSLYWFPEYYNQSVESWKPIHFSDMIFSRKFKIVFQILIF